MCAQEESGPPFLLPTGWLYLDPVPSPHTPPQLLYLDCIACITFGQEHHLVTAETHGQQQRLTSGPRGCSSLVQNCQPLRPASLNWPPNQPHPHLWPGHPSHLQPSPASGLRQAPPLICGFDFQWST